MGQHISCIGHSVGKIAKKNGNIIQQRFIDSLDRNFEAIENITLMSKRL